jgi:hypothetical protein
MDSETPPDWVLLEAAKRANIEEEPIEYLRKIYPRAGSFRALCDMIAKHEKPPVDRKLLCAREALREWSEMGYEAIESIRGRATHAAIATRAIELWEEGFGK